MNAKEQLAVLTAMEKAVKERIRKVRAEVDRDLRLAYEDEGVEKMALRVGGQKVGEIGVSYASDGYDVADMEAFAAFALDYGLATTRKAVDPEMINVVANCLERNLEPDVYAAAVKEEVVLDKDWEKAMERVGDVVCYMDSGMPVPGVEYRPKKVRNTVVRGCAPDEVLPAVASLPGGLDGLLLEGGAE